MTGCSMAAKRMGNDLITGKQKIGDISNSMKTATASTKALGVAMNVFANVGFMLAITAVTKVITELAQAQSKAVEAAQEATESYKGELTSLEEYKTKVSELHKELNSENISYEDSKTIREELLVLQDELIQKYGNEKTAIENITTAIKGEVDALDELNEKAYRDWVAKADETTFWNISGKSGLDQAIDYMETDQTVSFYDMQNANLSEELQAIQKEIDETIQSKYNLDKTFAMFNVTGTPEEIKSQLETIRQDYMDLSKEAFLENGISSELWEEYRKEALDSINEVINKFDEGLGKHQETYQTYIEGMIKYDSEYSDEYANILQKRAELESAQSSGNQEEIQKAKQSFMDAINEGIISSGSDENIKKYFQSLYPELQSEFSNWSFEFDLKANIEGLKDDATEIGEQYTAVDLLDMVNTEGTQEGEDAFNSLIDKAIEYGVCTDNSAEEVQKLIDLLVELGYVQGNVISGIESNIDSLSFTEIISQVQSLSDEFDQLDSIYTDVFDKGDFDWSSILNNEDFANAFSGYTAEYENFIKTVSNAPDDLAACQSAFDELVTAFVYGAKDTNGNNLMSQLTTETKEATVAMLEQYGVVNSLQIVEAQLAQNEQTLSNAKREQNEILKQSSQAIQSEAQSKFFAQLATIDLTNAETDEIMMLIEEANVCGITAQSLVNLALAKMDVNNWEITTTDDINNLLAMAEAAGVAGNSIAKLTSIKAGYEMAVAEMNAGVEGADKKAMSLATMMEQEVSKIKNDLLNFKPTVQVNYGGGSKYKDALEKANSSDLAKDIADAIKDTSSDETEKEVEQFEKQYNWIEKLLDKLAKVTEKWKDSSEKFFSWWKKNAVVDKAIQANRNEIVANQDAIDYYEKKAKEVELPKEYRELIENGDIRIEDIQDEELSNKIEEYQEWYKLKCHVA